MSNQTRFYYDKMARARQVFEDSNLELADDMCCELVTEFEAPRILQVQAYQLRSLCTQDYW